VVAPLFLIGFMAAGKTSVGRALAASSRRRFVDLDEAIAERGEPASQLVARDEAAFRVREAAVLREVIAAGADTVIATGGGAATFGDNLARMRAAGLVVALAFLRFAAPDLALTQLSVEVVTIVLLLMALRYLPQEAVAESSPARRWRDAGLATLGGLGAAALCFAMLTRPFDTISGYHIAQSVPGGGGTNVVNVILVDFRGFDTLGEIAVLAMAALGLHALLDGLRLAPQAGGVRTDDRYPVMLAMLMRPLLPLAITVSIYIFLRGHNLPGGGFIAGLVTAIALMLQYVAGGIDFAQARLRINYVRLLGLGLAIAVATGLASWLFGRPFLTSAHGYVSPPIVGAFEIASAMAFDLGVYLVVIGTVMLALTELGLLGRRERTPPAGTAQGQG